MKMPSTQVSSLKKTEAVKPPENQSSHQIHSKWDEVAKTRKGYRTQPSQKNSHSNQASPTACTGGVVLKAPPKSGSKKLSVKLIYVKDLEQRIIIQSTLMKLNGWWDDPGVVYMFLPLLLAVESESPFTNSFEASLPKTSTLLNRGTTVTLPCSERSPAPDCVQRHRSQIWEEWELWSCFVGSQNWYD